MFTINLSDLEIPKVHHYLLGAISPRPICFASTIDKEGLPNLAPFSFFNVFSANPPIAIFSPSRSGRTGETKDTLKNLYEVPEVVINLVNYDMVQQMSLASSPYERGISEFQKAGLTPIPSDAVKPFRVKESPIQLECVVNEIKELGQGGGAGNLVICQVLKIHIDPNMLDEKQMIDQQKIDLVSRMGGNWYCRAHGDALFEIDKPITTCGIGVDSLPNKVRQNKQLSGNHLGKLGNLNELPQQDFIQSIRSQYQHVSDKTAAAIALLNKNNTMEALALLLSED
jgi:flavin reductase (DIM6/NTAB) family NADH-FMN oxidoreductase RutF